MSATYSINIGTQFESYKKTDILSVLIDLPDNTNKLISPKDVRDAFLTVWASSPFKQTKNSTGSGYIGIDSGNPSNRDIKEKILLGKRSVGNLDILSDSLLNSSNADIFIFNTKSDSSSQDSTIISILAGTNSSLYQNAPYIESKYDPLDETIDLNLRNINGSINIHSDLGRVAINGILFPTVSETSANASNGKILRYSGIFPDGILKWDNTNVTIANIGTIGQITNIYGSTVSLNGYELEFVNNSLVPLKVAGVPSGFSFSSTSFNGGKWPIVEVIKKILYPYTPPVSNILVTNVLTGTKYVEIGTTPTLSIKWNLEIYPRSSSEYISDYLILADNLATIGTGLSFSGLPGTTFSGTASLIASPSGLPITKTYSISFSDVGNISSSYPTGFSHSSTSSIEYVYPVYYGFSSTIITNDNFVSVSGSLSKLINPYPGLSNSISPIYNGNGYLYFIYHNTFPTNITSVNDPNGFIIHDLSTYNHSSFGPSSSTSIFGSYRVWRTVATCSQVSGKFNFNF